MLNNHQEFNSTKRKNSRVIKVTIESEVEQDWLDLVLSSSYIFRRSCCGYWARGYKIGNAWLVWEDDEAYEMKDEPGYEEAVRSWGNRDKKLPSGWHRFDEQTAIRAWSEGVKRWGSDWAKTDNDNRYDYVIQKAILGVVRYK